MSNAHQSQLEQFLKDMSVFYRSDIVEVDEEAIKNDIAIREATTNSDAPPDYLKTDKDILSYFLILNSINHQFWTPGENNTMIRYSHDNRVGAIALHHGMAELVKSRGLDPQTITADDIRTYFGEMPNPEERAAILTQAFSQAKSLASDLLSSAHDGWAIMDAVSISQRIPLGYGDAFLKKAQLCLYMSSVGIKTVTGRDIQTTLTSFADYQVPRVQRHRGWLKYGPELAEKITNGELIPSGSVEEKAIRYASMLACYMAEKHHGVKQEAQDFWLWLQRNSAKDPFHKTVGRDY